MSFILSIDSDMHTRDESRDAMESPHARPVTPNDDHNQVSASFLDLHGSSDSFSHSPSFESASESHMQDHYYNHHHRSPSIPIASGPPTRTPSEIRQEHEQAMADYRDYAMYSRIVDGITKTLATTRDCRWRHANDVSLQHVYAVRHDNDNATMKKSNMLPSKLQLPAQSASLMELLGSAPFGQDEYHGEDEEEQVLFPLDL
jgi:hypothetical protein